MRTASPASRPIAAPDPQWAWAPYRPDEQRPWDLRRAAHLYRRAAFGASWEQLDRALAEGPGRTVERLLQPGAQEVAAFERRLAALEDLAIDPNTTSIEALREWWLRRAIETPDPLRETLALIWHSHFGVSNLRVRNGGLVHEHVRLLRLHGLGPYGDMLRAVANDPALWVGHDAGQNRRSRPNPNLAAALVGPLTTGQATAPDVEAAARALSGWFVLRNQLRFLPHEHDGGTKRLLGEPGPWALDDVLRIACAHPATSRNLARVLYRGLVSEADEPDDALLEPLAEALGPRRDVARAVETILRSNLFYSPLADHRLLKSPVGLAVGLARSFEGVVPTRPLGRDLADLGQDLGQPPTTAGWVGGTTWINTATWIGRANLVAALIAGQGSYGGKLDPSKVLRRQGVSDPESVARRLVHLLVAGDSDRSLIESITRMIAAGPGDPAGRIRAAVLVIAQRPEFHLA